MNPAQTSQTVLDPSVFKGLSFEQSNDTVFVPVPTGEFLFTIESCDIIQWQKKDLSAKGLKCVMKLSTTDEAIAGITGRPKSTLEYEFLLDLTPEGGLDFGKGMNVNLGRAREACGLNKPGERFMFDMFTGRQVKASVKHDPWEGRLIAKVTGIAAALAGANGSAAPTYVPGQ